MRIFLLVSTGSVSVINRQLISENESLKKQVKYLQDQLSQLRRLIYGAKSERFIPYPNQLGLFEGGSAGAQQKEESTIITYARKKAQAEKEKPVRQLLPTHLPRVEEVVEPLHLLDDSLKIGEEITEVLEYDPGHLYVRRIVRPKYKHSDQIMIGDLPSLPIPKGNAGAGLLAHIQVSKWVDHLPYYRQVQMFKRQGVALSESTINGWFRATTDLLKPLYEALVRQVQQAHYLQADESPIKVQDGHKKNSCRTGYHWVYHAPKAKLVVFDYRPTRSRNGPKEFLNDFSGNLQTDGYTAYDNLGLSQRITLLACMAHARRYFEKALDNDHTRAAYVLEQIQQLYLIEKDIKDEGEQQRLSVRVQYARPILERLKTYLDDHLSQTLPKSSMGKAIRYTLKLWPRLIRYTEKGSFHIDNNLIENTIRPLALGRKNYLFAGSNKAAQRAAMMYSLFATCKMHNVQPFAWLKDVLNRIPKHPINLIDQLLPHISRPHA